MTQLGVVFTSNSFKFLVKSCFDGTQHPLKQPHLYGYLFKDVSVIFQNIVSRRHFIFFWFYRYNSTCGMYICLDTFLSSIKVTKLIDGYTKHMCTKRYRSTTQQLDIQVYYMYGICQVSFCYGFRIHRYPLAVCMCVCICTIL